MNIKGVEGCLPISMELLDNIAEDVNLYRVLFDDRDGGTHEFLLFEEAAGILHNIYAARQSPTHTFTDVVGNLHTVDLTFMCACTTRRTGNDKMMTDHSTAFQARKRDEAFCEHLRSHGIDPDSEQGQEMRAKTKAVQLGQGGIFGAIMDPVSSNKLN